MPVVIVFDDLHWGEPALFDLVDTSLISRQHGPQAVPRPRDKPNRASAFAPGLADQ
jgi:hypothetical protein